MEPLNRRIYDLLQRKDGGSYSSLARHLNITPQAVQQWFDSDDSRRTTPRGSRVEDIASYFGMSRRQLEFPEGVDPIRPATPGASHVIRPTPVLGTAKLGTRGFFLTDPVEAGTDGYVLFDGGADAYALRCVGDSMVPRIQPGMFMVITPHKRAAIDDLVVCQTIAGERMIKLLRSRYDGYTVLASINADYRDITLDAHEIGTLHRAIGPFPPESHVAELG